MCKSKSEGGSRCNSKVARLVCSARAVIAEKEAAGEPVTLPAAPSDRGIVHPEQTRIFEQRWPDDDYDVVIRRCIVTDTGQVFVPDPAKHEVTSPLTAVSDQEKAEWSRRGVAMAVNRRTGEYVTYEARDTNGVWELRAQVDAGAKTAPAAKVPDWLANHV